MLLANVPDFQIYGYNQIKNQFAPCEAESKFNPQGPVSICDNNAVNIEAINGTQFQWSTGETTSSINLNTSGNYSVTITDVDGCTGTNDIDVTNGTSPTANFTMSLSGSTLTTNNTSSGATTYTWLFGDGANSTSTNPTHTYTTNGLYTVTLIATNGGCTDTITHTVEVFTGIASILKPTVRVYPNPTDGNALVEIGSVDGETVLTLTDVLGRVALSQHVTEKTTVLNLTNLASGMYELTVRSQGWQRTEKLVKQ